MRKVAFASLVILVFLAARPAHPQPGPEPQLASEPRAEPPFRAVFAYETGPAAILQNDGQYGENGTRYGAEDVGQDRNLLRVERASVELRIRRHAVILLYAPFAVTTRFRPEEEFRFRDAVFAPDTVVDHRYVFDGYRASWLFRLLEGRWWLDLGASFQVRNAEVAFSSAPGAQPAQYDTETDIGLVFALKARAGYRPASGPWGELEADGFSTFGIFDNFSGGIYDVALTLGIPVAAPLDLTLSTRLLGGGAEVADRHIDNWANFFSAAIGARIDIGRLLGGP
jgi:hypothetical protein